MNKKGRERERETGMGSRERRAVGMGNLASQAGRRSRNRGA